MDKISIGVIFDNFDKGNFPVGDEIADFRMIYQGESKYILNDYSSKNS